MEAKYERDVPSPFTLPSDLTEHFRRWARLRGDRVCDTLGGIPDDVYPAHYLGASGKGILQHVALADDDG